MDASRTNVGNKELEYLENKRIALHLTQDEFGKLFDISGDIYRKYISRNRGLKEINFRMMKIIITYYEAAENSINSISVSNYLEHLRESSLNAIFNEEQQVVVNVIFDYIIRNIKNNFN